jgi:hypothetical protein
MMSKCAVGAVHRGFWTTRDRFATEMSRLMFNVADKVDESMEIVSMQVSFLRHVRARGKSEVNGRTKV